MKHFAISLLVAGAMLTMIVLVLGIPLSNSGACPVPTPTEVEEVTPTTVPPTATQECTPTPEENTPVPPIETPIPQDTPIPVIFPSPTLTINTVTVVVPTWTNEPGGGGKHPTKIVKPTLVLIINTPVEKCTQDCVCLIGTELAEANDLTRTQIAISLTQSPNSCPIP